MGSYHGQHGFDEFSHLRAVLRRAWDLDLLAQARYPPYSDKMHKMLKKATLQGGPLPKWVGTVLKYAAYAAVPVLAAVAFKQLA
jgi:aldehyde dehydrogenase (NAD+)